MLEVKRIVNDIFTSNTYLLFEKRYSYCWLIDIGDYSKVADVLPQGVEIRGVFITHAHFDHIYGLNSLHLAWPDCNVYTSVFGRDALYSDKVNLSRYHECPIVYKGDSVNTMVDGEKIEIFPGVHLTSYETPGHSPCCLTYIVDNFVFTGDAFIPGVKVVTKLPGGNKIQAKHSIEKIKSLSQGKYIYPGHCDPISE